MKTFIYLNLTSLFHAEVPPAHPRPLSAKPVVPRRILPHPDINRHATQPLVGHPQSTSNTLITTIARESRVAVVYQGNPFQPLSVEHWEIS